MEHWFVPVISVVIVVEWLAIAWKRRKLPGDPSRHQRTRITLLDFIIVVVGAALFISSLQYLSTSAGETSRIALGTLRVVLFLTGLYIIWDEHEQHGR